MRLKHSLPAAAAMLSMLMSGPNADAASVQPYKHIVVIYQENHSFDNLYGLWGDVNGTPVNGIPNIDSAHTWQVRQDNMTAYSCLKQLDVNLTSPTPLATTCTDNTGTPSFVSAFTNAPFKIDDYIASTDTTCPNPVGAFSTNGFVKGTGLPGGCTRDIVHRYYTEKYQINGGTQNRYMTGSDASGLVMGVYDSTKLPIYTYLHSAGAPNYVITDNFFQGAFGGSFLNHQWLIAAAAPVFANAPNDGSATDLHSVVDTNGMATSTPLYTPTVTGVIDSQLVASCSPPAGRPATPAGVTCGDYAVNTTQPTYWPYSPGTALAKRLPPLTNTTIGDNLTAAGVDWAWYSGGWSNANGMVGAPGWTNGTAGTGTNGTTCSDANANKTTVWPLCPDVNFQYHHQPFNYYVNYAPGTQARADHLKDEAEFIAAAQNGTLKPVSFIKAVGEENEHPGYTSESNGSNHLVDLIQAVVNGPNAKDTLIIVTYDEFGGQWDHAPVPTVDQWGPGTRIATLLVSAKFAQSGVDHQMHDTTSIMKTIEERFRLAPIGTRDANISSLDSALSIANP